MLSVSRAVEDCRGRSVSIPMGEGVVEVKVKPIHENAKSFFFWKAHTSEPSTCRFPSDWGGVVGSKVKFAGKNRCGWYSSVPCLKRLSQEPREVFFDIVGLIHIAPTISNIASIVATKMCKMSARGEVTDK